MEDSGIVDLYWQRPQQAVLDAHVPRPVTLTPVP